MASVDNIQGSILLGQAYYKQLLDQDTANRQVGIAATHKKKLACLKRLMRALQWDLDIDVNDDITTVIYDLLFDGISGYNGVGLSVDPSVIIPGKVIVINNPVTANYNEGIITFTNQTTVGIYNYNTTLAKLYGNNPSVFIYQTGFTEDEQTPPTYTYQIANDPTSPLLSIVWTYPFAVSGYIKISGSVPVSGASGGTGGTGGATIFTYTQADLLQDSNGAWCLPLILALGQRPGYTESNGVQVTTTFDTTFSPPRLYGFANNSAQNISVYVI